MKGRGLIAGWVISDAPWLAPLVFVALLFSLSLLSPSSVRSQGGGMAFAAMVVLPSILVTLIAKCLPRRFRVSCHKCGCARSYSLKCGGEDEN